MASNHGALGGKEATVIGQMRQHAHRLSALVRRSPLRVFLLALCAYGAGVLLGILGTRVLHRHQANDGLLTTNLSLKAAIHTRDSNATDSSPTAISHSPFLPGPGTALQVLEAKLRVFDNSTEDERPFQISQIIPLLYALDPHEYPKAWNLVKNLQSTKWREEMERRLFRAWAKKDTPAALAAVQKSSRANGPTGLILEVLQIWAQNKPEDALAWVRQRPAKQQRDIELGTVIQSISQQNPQLAASLLTDLPAGFNRSSTAYWVLKQLALVDPEAAIKMLDETKGSSRLDSLGSIGAAKAVRGDRDVVAWALTLPSPEDQEAVLTSVVFHWAETSLDQAIEFVQSQSDRDMQSKLAGAVARGWSIRDEEAALAWVRQLPEPSVRQKAWQEIKGLWVYYHPEAAADFVLTSFPAGTMRTEELERTASLWSWFPARDPFQMSQAEQWANQLPSGPDRDAFVSGLCSSSADYYPDFVAGLATTMAPGETQTKIIQELAKSWSHHDPENAATWSTSLPSGQAKSEALKLITGNWAEADPVSAGQWLQALSAEDARSVAVEAYVAKTANRCPDLAAEVVDLIGQEAKRNQQIEYIARRWLQRDPAAAQAWLLTTSLPEERRLQLLTSP